MTDEEQKSVESIRLGHSVVGLKGKVRLGQYEIGNMDLNPLSQLLREEIHGREMLILRLPNQQPYQDRYIQRNASPDHQRFPLSDFLLEEISAFHPASVADRIDSKS